MLRRCITFYCCGTSWLKAWFIDSPCSLSCRLKSRGRFLEHFPPPSSPPRRTDSEVQDRIMTGRSSAWKRVCEFLGSTRSILGSNKLLRLIKVSF
ncbi:hypothetical protein AXF42_Ash000793 [Apostasia shenzhenica]|uniref:Uncharacterized protein n=1 Tax=Apostasia shenzhenica TaxID=1088818 RepID=A0A2I0AT30_9ASPA|nr:hypothetical protein AXF42_Ash000793 [Apostasia shenzhenica]